jgi:hypothetical protein
VPKFVITCRNVHTSSRNWTVIRAHTINQRPRPLLFTLSQLVETKSYPRHLVTESCSATAALIWSLDPQFQWQYMQLYCTSTSSYFFFGAQGKTSLYGTVCCLKPIWKFRLQIADFRHRNVKRVLTYRREQLIFPVLYSLCSRNSESINDCRSCRVT